MTAPLIQWDSPLWGVAGHNTHEASWAPDGTHDDNTDAQ